MKMLLCPVNIKINRYDKPLQNFQPQQDSSKPQALTMQMISINIVR